MKTAVFPYIKYLVSPPNIRPSKFAYRPVIPVKLITDENRVSFDAVIDSGADECTFPGWIAELLGHNLYKGNQRIFSGIGGSTLAYLHKTKIKLKDFVFTIDAYFSNDWNEMPFGLLGQLGFFSNFRVQLDYKNAQISLYKY